MKLTASQNKVINIVKHYKSPTYYSLVGDVKMGIWCYDSDELFNMMHILGNNNSFVFGTDYLEFIGYNIKDVYVSERLLFMVNNSDENYEKYKTDALKLIHRMNSRFGEYNFIFEDLEM